MKTKTQQEVISLLPWYNLGKLSDDERAMIENALEEDTSLKEHLLIEQSMSASIKDDKTLLDLSLFDSSESRLTNVLAKIDLLEESKEVSTQQVVTQKAVELEVKQSIFAKLKLKLDDLLTSSSHNFTYAVFAALTVVQLGLLVFFIVPSANMGPESEFEVASSDTHNMLPSTGVILLFDIGGHINLGGTTRLSNGAKINLLPGASGYYRVQVSKTLSKIELQELTNELSKKHGDVKYMGEEASF